MADILEDWILVPNSTWIYAVALVAEQDANIAIWFKAKTKAGLRPGPKFIYTDTTEEEFQSLLRSESKGNWIKTVLKDRPYTPLKI